MNALLNGFNMDDTSHCGKMPVVCEVFFCVTGDLIIKWEDLDKIS